ncbi:MAG: hypothetical protein LBJ67_10555 [Planctomycetaceae bacterium]|jgi:hypothetical protein|nr:hypothetical protein [Planctomycetaceae bacterium]
MSKDFDRTLTGVGYRGLRTRAGLRRYLEINGAALVSILLGLIGVAVFFTLQAIVIPIIGLLIGLWALYRHLDSPKEVGGFYLAIAGISISIATAFGGTGYTLWNYFFSVPRGYTVVDFAEMKLTKDGKIQNKIAELGRQNKKVFLKGYMYQDRMRSGLVHFVLVRTVAHCKFCSPFQNPADMIDVSIVNGQKVNYRTAAVHVGGTLFVNENFTHGEMPYHIEADVFR